MRRVPAYCRDSVTILLAKITLPTRWRETRPITLSSALLKTAAQLLLQRCRRLLLDEFSVQ